MNHWLGIGLVLAILIGTIMLLRRISQRYKLHPELVRKLLHLAMGLTVLALLWLFNTLWPVLVLAAVTISTLWLLRKSGRLQCRLSGVIDGVARKHRSYGELFFPLGVAILFIFSHDQPMHYAIPILLLTTADPAAALVGLRYGRRHYRTPDGYKSVEGSAAFAAVAFFTTLVPLLWSGAASTAGPFLTALILGLLLMLVEAIAWRGSDNLLIPVVGFVLLRILSNFSLTELTAWTVLTGALVVFVMRRYFRWHLIRQHGSKPANSSTIFANPRRYRL